MQPGFQIELIASEPLIADPVAMEIDENGNLYVVEMTGNPFSKNTGKLKLLRDTDGDGVMDESIVFADSLIMPSGVMRWKKGVLVTDPPHVVYLEDSDNDGRADIRREILSGFDSTDLESNVNNPIYGLDNWIYVANGPGNREGDISYTGDTKGPRLPDNADGHVVRFRPDARGLEMASGSTQFGHTFDAWGAHLLVNNFNHIYHEVMEAQYLARRPDLLVSDAMFSISDHGESADVYPVTQNPEHQLLTDVGVFTSACGIMAYGGGLFPAPFDSVVFVAEPVSNLVHADRIRQQGATFSASRVYENAEFMASTDAWSRPVNMYIGPDGALYVVDYYRQIIEGPEWMAEEVVRSGKLYNGSDRGRIFRITPSGTEPLSWSNAINLGSAPPATLVATLGNPNIWWRRHAQRMLVDLNSPETVPALVAMVREHESPVGRVHALWTLEGMKSLPPSLIEEALRDPVSGVRVQAIKLAELQLSAAPALRTALLALRNDNDARVRYQLLCTLGFVDSPEAAAVRQELLFRNIQDPWFQLAALSAPSLEMKSLLYATIARYHENDASLVKRLSAMIAGTEQPALIGQLITRATSRQVVNDGWQVPVLEGIAEGIPRRKVQYSQTVSQQERLLNTFFGDSAPNVRQACLQVLQATGLLPGPHVQAAMQRALSVAQNQRQSPDDRAAAIQFLALGDAAPFSQILKSLIGPQEPPRVQLAALETLSGIQGVSVSDHVLTQWKVLTPEVRDAALNTFLIYPFQPKRLELLLDAIEAGEIRDTDVGWSRSVVLMRDIPDSLKSRARVLLTKQNERPEELLKKYEQSLTMATDYKRGEAVFKKNCSLCHQKAGKEGHHFGPDISTVRNWTPETMLVNILDPGISIANGYDLWAVEMKTGEVKQGIIASESPASITLLYPGGQQIVVPREDVRSLRALNMSAMPPGLEKQINEQEMADLLSYLRQPDVTAAVK